MRPRQSRLGISLVVVCWKAIVQRFNEAEAITPRNRNTLTEKAYELVALQ